MAMSFQRLAVKRYYHEKIVDKKLLVSIPLEYRSEER